jgi:hypothetical protein
MSGRHAFFGASVRALCWVQWVGKETLVDGTAVHECQQLSPSKLEVLICHPVLP